MTFVCDHCGTEFLSFDELQAHKDFVITAGEQWPDSWVCPKCARKFSSPGLLKEHEEQGH